LASLKKQFRAFSRRLGSAASVFRSGDAGALSVERHGAFDVAFRKGTSDERVIAHSFTNDIFYAAMPDYVPAPDHVILDVGSHIGTFALLSASKVPNGRVWAIEASRDTFNYLRINAAINGLANLGVHHLALSDKKGTARLHHDAGGNWGHSIMAELSSAGEEVETETLADYMSANAIQHIDFAKFNCEGAEFPILIGASVDTLARIERMLVLFHCDLVAGYKLDNLTNALEAAGFSLEITANKKQRGRIIARRAGSGTAPRH
jgi:FkbM family methyltransferase